MLLAAPHTSNWDFPLMFGIAYSLGVDPKWLGKKEMFVGPLGWLWRKLGGIPVDRDDASGLVESLVSQARSSDRLGLVIPAEGTRSKAEYWKSGFYRVARDADIPLIPAFIDGPTRTCGVGPALPVTGDVSSDMDAVRAFYADKHGVKPKNRTEPRLREEDRQG